MSLPTEAHLVIAGVGLCVGLSGLAVARRHPKHVAVALMVLIGFGAFIGACLNAMDSADLSHRAQGLWLYGGVAATFGAFTVLGVSRRVRGGTRGELWVAGAIATLMTASFVSLAVWNVDLADHLPHRGF